MQRKDQDTKRVSLVVVFSLALCGFTCGGQLLEKGHPAVEGRTDPIVRPFDARLLEIAQSYESYGRIDPE